MDLSIIIVNWNTCDLLVDCLNSIQENLGAAPDLQAEIFVVDNASSDSSVDLMQKDYSWVHLIENQENLGFARANNQAAVGARGRFFLLLNPDTYLHPGALEAMFNHLEKNHHVGAVGPRLLNPDGSLQVSAHPIPTLFREAWRLLHLDHIFPVSEYSKSSFQSNAPLRVDVLMGACIMLRREVIDQIGMFDEQFFMYSEEVDLCIRIHHAEWKVIWLPTGKVTHYGGQSTKLVADEMFLELYRNKVKIFRKHFGETQTTLYKIFLFFVSITRYIPALVVSLSPKTPKKVWIRKAIQYHLLLDALPDL